MFRRITAVVLTSIVLLNPLGSAFAQSSYDNQDRQLAAPEMMNPNENRVTGGSFGGNLQDGRTDDARRIQPQQPAMDRSTPQAPASMMGITYQVHILGEVRKPGTYRVPASTRLSEALQYAGGAMERGTDRRIQLRRRDGGGRTVDLQSFKMSGNLDANPYLLDNDVIFVPLKDRVVQVEGAVKRGGFYELRAERSVEDVIKLAGGFSPGAQGGAPIKIIRYERGVKNLIDVPNEPTSRRGFRVEDADVVIVPHIFIENKKFDYNLGKFPGEKTLFYPSYEERVFVLGAVARPGPYSFSPYYDVRQYLTVAGGTSKLAKIKKIKIITADGRTVKATNTTSINPGDTIVVPEKYMAPETFATLVIGITASVVGITSAIVTLAK